MPLVSVVIAARDGERFLDAAMRSVLQGAFSDLELVVVDDGSVDATPAILAGWARRHPRVRVLTLERSLGTAAARNRGMAVAHGEFIAPHDHDDLFVPERLEPQVAALRADPGAVLVAGSTEIVDARGRHVVTRRFDEPAEVLAHVLPFGNPIMHGSVLYRRDHVLAAGGYAAGMIGSYDYDLWLRLAARGRILALPVVSLRYRWHDAQTTVRDAAAQREESIANTRRALPAALGREPSAAEVEAVANVWRETGVPCDNAVADRVLREALARSPHAADPAFRTRVARLTAERWVAQASRLALARHPVAALDCLRRAAAWDPRGAAALVARRVAWLGAVRYRTRDGD